LPGVANEPLSANLRIAALTYHDEGIGVHGCRTKTSYEALSYTWGEPRFTHAITINGHMFNITRISIRPSPIFASEIASVRCG